MHTFLAIAISILLVLLTWATQDVTYLVLAAAFNLILLGIKIHD